MDLVCEARKYPDNYISRVPGRYNIYQSNKKCVYGRGTSITKKSVPPLKARANVGDAIVELNSSTALRIIGT